jgi:4-hydroxy-4-methyl-2-oxoglutarate aldolase
MTKNADSEGGPAGTPNSSPLVEALRPEELQALRQLTTCQVADAIETFSVRLRNEGFMDSSIRCLFPRRMPVVGYAVTGRIRTADPPPVGKAYPDRTDWWSYIESIPAPRIIVLEDRDRHAGCGSCAGEVHATIFRALGCAALITNGSVRDLDAVESMEFAFFSGGVAVSHGYFHLAEFGVPVEVGGLVVHSGDLLHGDRHGVLNVPISIARGIPAAAQRIAARDRRVLEVAGSPDASIEDLRQAVRETMEPNGFHS